MSNIETKNGNYHLDGSGPALTGCIRLYWRCSVVLELLLLVIVYSSRLF